MWHVACGMWYLNQLTVPFGVHFQPDSDEQTGQAISPRTSVASSIRFSEDSMEPDLASGGVAPGSGWFDKVFKGMSFGLPDRWVRRR